MKLYMNSMPLKNFHFVYMDEIIHGIMAYGTWFILQSKGGILAKACEYIVELRSSNQRLAECLKDNERLTMDMEIIQRQNEELKRDNSLLRAQLSQHGIIPPPDLSNPTVS